MGQLYANCVAPGSDNALYALSFGFDQTNGTALAIMLKSNASPSPSTLTWTVVSTVAKTEVFAFDTSISKTECLVDPNGAFTAFNYDATRNGPGTYTSSVGRPGGFRYDPSLSTSSNSTTGKGGWMNIDTPLSYPWTSISIGSSLFYVKDNSGKYNVYHTYLPDSSTSAFKFGALNTAPTPYMMETSNATWPVSPTVGGYHKDVQLSLTKIFYWGTVYPDNTFAVGDLPQTGLLPSSTPSLKVGNFSTPNACSRGAVYGDKAYKYCTIQLEHGNEYKLYSWDGSKALDPIEMPEPLVTDSYMSDANLAVFADSTTSYLLVRAGLIALKALVLTGATAGSVVDVPNNMTVQDNIAYDYNKLSLGSTLTGILKVVGIVFGFLVVCCAVILHRSKTVVAEKRLVLVPVLIDV